MRSERSPDPTWLLRSAERASSSFLAFHVVEAGAQQAHGTGAVLVLRALVLHEDHHAARQMRDADGGLGLVDVLAARALGAHRVDLEVRLVDVDVDLLGLR